MTALNTLHGSVPRLRKRRPVDLACNVVLLGALWLGYSAVRGVTADDIVRATEHSRRLLELQSVLGLPSELQIQQGFLDQSHIIRGANFYYVGAHFPLTLAFLGWAWLKHPTRFGRVRNTLVGVTGAGLLIHVMYPLAPPRMMGGFVDTAAVYGPNPYDLSIAKAANQIAAMPSLHVGWALLVALGVLAVSSSRWRWLVVVHPMITVAVVVLTANHYWLDVLAATALVGAGWLISGRHERLRYRPAAQPTQIGVAGNASSRSTPTASPQVVQVP